MIQILRELVKFSSESVQIKKISSMNLFYNQVLQSVFLKTPLQ